MRNSQESDAPAVFVEALTKTYRSRAGDVAALSGVTYVFARGSFTAVMGPSGSGKSTLLQCAAGLDRPTAGRVFVDDVELGSLGERALTKLRRDRLGFVFQAYNLLPALTAHDNVALPLRLAGKRPDRRVVMDALDRVGLHGEARRLPAQLSGGQQQRVAIARSLVASPAVLFVDEPTGALDTAAGRQVLGLLRQAVDERGQTVLMVTHDPAAAAYADATAFLRDGRIAGSLTRPSPAQIAATMSELEAA